jgi:hypothetical protein
MSLEPLVRAAQVQLPPNSEMFVGHSNFDFHDFTWTVGVGTVNPGVSPRFSCCSGGVSVVFKIVRGKFVPVGASYKDN